MNMSQSQQHQQPPPMFSPPAQQPLKKQRATETPDRLTVQTDDAISRRKAELARLQQQLPRPNGASGGTDLLARARMSLNNNAAAGMPTGPRPPPMPGQQPMIQPRTSDLYPEAPKTAVRPGPPPGGPSPSSPPGTTPETAKVVRRLDVTFASNRQSVSPPSAMRAKSAPPQRPPPPGPPPVVHAEDPENSRPPPGAATTATAGPPPPPPRPPAPAPPKQPQQQPPPPPKPATTAAPAVSFAPDTALPAVSFAAAPETLPELAMEPELLSPPAQGNKKQSTMDIDFGSDSHDNDFYTHSNNDDGDDAPTPVQTPAAKPVAKRRNTPYLGRAALDLSQGSEDDDEDEDDAAVAQETTTPSTIDLLRREADQQPPRSAVFTGNSNSISSPPPPSVDLRLAKELARAEQEKAHALERVTELEHRLADLQQPAAVESGRHGNSGSSFGALFDKIREVGVDAALDWAHQQTLNPPDNGSNGTGTSNNSAVNQLSRRKSPMPRPKQAQELDLGTDLLMETVKQLPYEFIDDSLLTSFIIRRPYGVEDDRELWLSAGQRPSKAYANHSSVTQCQSLELVARIPFDGSVLALFDEGNVRHQNPMGDWDDLGNVYHREGPLGQVFYVDKAEGTQKMYSLDHIFDSAIAIRQFYCQSVLSAAAGLKRGIAMPSLAPPAATSSTDAAASPGKDIGVDTNDLPKPKAAAKAESKPAPPSPPEESPDVATLFLNMVVSGILGLLWSVFVRLPMRILFNTIALAAAVAALALMWVYFENNSGAAHYGSSFDLMFNQPGVM